MFTYSNVLPLLRDEILENRNLMRQVRLVGC